ncbi:hypothetical protein D3C74_207430 [compost metagenome]
MTVHVTMPNIYHVEGYGIDGFTKDHIEIGKTYKVISGQGNVLVHQVTGIDKPSKGMMQILRLNEGDTKDVTIDAFVKVMRGRGIPDGRESNSALGEGDQNGI